MSYIAPATLKPIKKAMIDAEISFADLARELRVSRQHIQKVAKGERISYRVRRHLCRRLHLNPKDLGWNGLNGRAA